LGRTIAICNQKGGVGKSTTAIGVASYLGLAGKNTLLIDLDPQSNATSGIGVNKHTVKRTIYEVLNERVSLEDIVISAQIDNVFVAPSGLNLTGAEVELVNIMSREYRLKKAIAKIKHKYDFILIDCPPSLGLLTVNALTAADSVLIPVQCEYYALEGLSQLINTIKLIKDNLNNELEVEGVLLTMADYRTNLTKEVIDEVKKFFGDKVYSTIIPRSIKLTEAPGFGKPIALYDNNSSGAQAYHSLTQEVLGSKEVFGREVELSLRGGAEGADEAISTEPEGEDGKTIG
jgi:chromosome partitioning protein